MVIAALGELGVHSIKSRDKKEVPSQLPSWVLIL
jgi:hypothetical protein